MVVQQPHVQPQVPPQTAVPTAQASQAVGPGVQVRAPRRGSGGTASARHPWMASFWLDRAGPGVPGAAPPGVSGFELHRARATPTLRHPGSSPLASFPSA